MRFLHPEIEGVVGYLASGRARIISMENELRPVIGGTFILPWTVRRRDAHAPVAASVDDVVDYDRQNSLPERGGLAPGSYFHVNPPDATRAVSLAGAVEHVEAYGQPEEFLLVGYADGGFISISKGRLQFQSGVDEANWWRP